MESEINDAAEGASMGAGPQDDLKAIRKATLEVTMYSALFLQKQRVFFI